MNNVQAPLSLEIEKAYNNLLKIIATIPPQEYSVKIIDTNSGKISVSDIIAYQLGWGNLLLSWYEAGLQNKIPLMPGEGFTKWDYTGLSHHFYSKYQYDAGELQKKEFNAIVTKIITIVEHEYRTKNLDALSIWEWCTLSSGKQWPLSKWIRVNTIAPYTRAAKIIRKQLINR